jgi:uncharacterized protein
MSAPISPAVRLQRTLPQPTAESQPFWDACARHELVLPRCASCERFWFPPANRCQHCWSDDYAWTPVSGRASLFTYTVYRRAYAPELVDQLPYVVGIVELEEGPRLITNVVDCDPDRLRVELPVEVVFLDIADGVALHAFRPRDVAAPQHPATTDE